MLNKDLHHCMQITVVKAKIKGGESSSQFRGFTIAKIQLFFFDIFCFDFGTAVAKIFNKCKKISPEKKFLETLSFVLPAKTTVGLIVSRTVVLAGRTKLRVSKNFFSGNIFLHLLNIFATTASKSKQKTLKIIVEF